MRAPSPDLQTASNDESHEPLECLVRGTLHAPDAEEVGSADAAVRLSRTPRGWLQTNETATAQRHLAPFHSRVPVVALALVIAIASTRILLHHCRFEEVS